MALGLCLLVALFAAGSFSVYTWKQQHAEDRKVEFPLAADDGRTANLGSQKIRYAKDTPLIRANHITK